MLRSSIASRCSASRKEPPSHDGLIAWARVTTGAHDDADQSEYLDGGTLPRLPGSASAVAAGARLVRHPMQLGFVIARWAAPVMTFDRLALALFLTGYIVTALVFEERDLVAVFGEECRGYQQRMPRLLPRLWPRKTFQRQSWG